MSYRPAKALYSKAGELVESNAVNLSPKGAQVEIAKISTTPGTPTTLSRRSWSQDKDLTRKVIHLLIEGNPPIIVAKKLGISKHLEHYHRCKAEEFGLIKRKDRGRPLFYAPGPLYEYRGTILGKGGSGRRISTSFCRLHPPHGNAFSFPVIKEGEQHELRTAEGDRLPLFSKRGGREASLPVPSRIPGCPKGTVKIYAHGGSLVISGVPNLCLPTPSTLEAVLGHENGPYAPLLEWLGDLLTSNGWRLGPPVLPSHYHLAFEIGPVLSSCPEILGGVSVLERGTEESSLIVWQDRSHGTPELETTDPGLALDLFTILKIAQDNRSRSYLRIPTVVQ